MGGPQFDFEAVDDDLFGDTDNLIQSHAAAVAEAVGVKKEKKAIETILAGASHATPAVAATPAITLASDLPKTGHIAWDIETGPCPWEEIEPFFKPPEPPGEFDESAVKYGNTKDAAKRLEKLNEAKAKHAAELANWENVAAAAREQFIADAALSPLTGQILAIGYRCGDATIIEGMGGNEAALLSCFWTHWAATADTNQDWIGHNIHGFDLPFIVKRSWLLGIEIPSGVYENKSGRVYWHPSFIDTMKLWAMGEAGKYSSLDTLARFFGVGSKPEGVSGADFARLWNGSAADKQNAIAYLANDVALTQAVAEKMGVA